MKRILSLLFALCLVLPTSAIRSWKARQDQARHEPVPRYIDEVWPNLKP